VVGGRCRANVAHTFLAPIASPLSCVPVIKSELLMMVRSHGEKRCSILGPTQSRISTSIVWHTEIKSQQAIKREGAIGGDVETKPRMGAMPAANHECHTTID
jgi:hypothetical protein